MSTSLLKKMYAGKSLYQTDKDKPFANDKTLKLIDSKSFADLLPVKQYSGDGIFYFRNLKNVGAMFSIQPVSLEDKGVDDKQAFLDSINFAIKQAIPAEFSEMWHSQIFITKTDTKEETFNAIKNHSKSDTQFSKHWLGEIDKHLTELANPEGAFVDKNTGVKFRVAKLEITMCLWQELASNNKQTLEERFRRTKEVLERLNSALEQLSINIELFTPQDYIHNLAGFFHTKKTHYNPNILTLVDSDLSEEALGKIMINCNEGVFTFSNNKKIRHSVYLAMEQISREPHLGHITAEQKDTIALFDKLPVGSTWAQTTVHMHEDLATQQLEQISKSVLGTDAVAVKNKQTALDALEKIAEGNSIYRFAAGVYLSTDNNTQINKLTRDARAIMGANGIEILDIEQNPMAEQDFVANLPFSFSYEKDKVFYNKRAILQDLNLISKLSPFVKRSTGTGSAGIMKFNRGGEPLMFDPVTDKMQNAFGLLFGPSGSGKSSFLIEHMFDMLKSHNPYRIFILEKGNSFGLAVDLLKTQGCSTHKISIKPESDNVVMPPFADAVKVLNKDVNANQHKKESRDLIEELSFTAQLMITNGVKKELDEFRQRDLFTIAEAIRLAAKNTIESSRKITLTEDIATALDMLSQDVNLTQTEKDRTKSMAQSIRAFIASGFSNKVFNQEGRLFPQADVTQLDVGYLGNPNQESKLLIAFMALMSEINALAEKNQYSGRPIFLYIDEAHLFTKHPVIIKYLLTMIKMWRKWNVWVWLATPSLKDYTKEASDLFDTIEWIVVLQANKKEIDRLCDLISITEQQQSMLLSMKGSNKQYKEGCVISPNLTTLFRSVPTCLALALAMTEPNEKADRQKIMNTTGCSELEAAYQMAIDISTSRTGQGV